MKQFILLLSSVVILTAQHVHAQTPFSTKDSVNINRINAQVLVHGDMWWDPVTTQAKCEFPKGFGRHISFASALWMSGYDAANRLHVAAQTYRQRGNDFWPGPLDTSDTLTYATSQDWAKIWKVNRTDIQAFMALTTHTIANTPVSILTWPASGNTYAAGNSGAALTIAAGRQMAPFIDLNGNGIYEPLSGDYPAIKGDQALWYILSDNGPSHTETNARPLGVEVSIMAYAYNRGTLIDNVIYYEYTIANKSTNTYHDFRMGQYTDMNLGCRLDDYLGFDSSHRMGIIYNGVNDDGVTFGFPPGSYGAKTPVVGLTMVVQPGDMAGSIIPDCSFVSYNVDVSSIAHPTIDTEYNHLMRSRLKDGSSIMSYFLGYGSVRFVYPGDPSDTGRWSECGNGNAPGERLFILSTNDFSLAPGQTQKIVMALVTTDTGQGGCPSVNFDDIKIVADTAWHVYQNPPSPLELHEIENGQIRIYPNPIHDRLFIETTAQADEHITIFNAIG